MKPKRVISAEAAIRSYRKRLKRYREGHAEALQISTPMDTPKLSDPITDDSNESNDTGNQPSLNITPQRLY